MAAGAAKLRVLDDEDEACESESTKDDLPPQGSPQCKKDTFSEIMREKKERLHESILKSQQDKDYDILLSKLTKAIHLYPEDMNLFIQRADAYLEVGDFSSAIVNLRHVWRTDTSNNEVKNKLLTAYTLNGQALFDCQLYERSLDTFQEARKLDPGSLLIRKKCIGCLQELKEFDRCMSLIQESLCTYPSNPDLLVLRARMNLLFGKTSLAYTDLMKAVKQDPSHSEAQSLITGLQEDAASKRTEAVKLSFAGIKEEAVKQITCAIETNPSLAEYHVFRGSLYRQLGRYNKAQSDFHTAVHKCGGDRDHPMFKLAMKQLALTYNDVAVAHFRRKRFSEAVQLLNQAVEVEKMEKVLYSNRGDCFYQLKEYHFARLDYEQSLELSPGDWSVQTRLAMVHCDLGLKEYQRRKNTDALTHFDRAIQSNPKVSRFYICRATVKHVLEDVPGAQQDVIFTLLLDSDNQDSQSILARVFPGQSVHEILKSRCALQQKEQLVNMIAKSVRRQESTVSKESDLSSDESLYGIDLKIIDSSELEQTGEGASSNVPEELNVSDSELEFEQNFDTENLSNEQDVTLSPRTKNAVSKPLPPIPTTCGGVMPDLKLCLNESQFHTDMYYSKRESDETFRNFLRKSPNFGSPPPKMGVAHEIKFGKSRLVEPIYKDLATK